MQGGPAGQLGAVGDGVEDDQAGCWSTSHRDRDGLLVYGQAMASVWAFYMVLDRYLARCLPAAGPVEQSRPSGARGGLGVREPADARGSRGGYLELTAAIGITLVLFPFGPAQGP